MAAGIDLFDGKQWTKVGPNKIRVRIGQEWQTAKTRLWDNYNWINISGERKTTTWEATWSQGYWSWGTPKGNEGYLLWKGNHPFKGVTNHFMIVTIVVMREE